MVKKLKALVSVSGMILLLIATALSADPSALIKDNHEITDSGRNISDSGDKSSNIRPVLTIKPRELNFGAIYPGESSEGRFIFKNVGSGFLQWSTSGPSGWLDITKRNLIGDLGLNQAEIDLRLQCLEGDSSTNTSEYRLFKVSLTMELGKQRIVHQKQMPAGKYRESIRIKSNGGTRTIFFRYSVLDRQNESSIQVEPLKIDFGILGIGEKKIQRIELNNRGKDPLEWYVVSVHKNDRFYPDLQKKGRYISFFNQGIKGQGTYELPDYLKDTLEIKDSWAEVSGYPAIGTGGAIKYSFSGTGVGLYVRKTPEGGLLRIFIDGKIIKEVNCSSEKPEQVEVMLAEGMTDMTHMLAIFNEGGQAVIEGVTIYGKDVKAGLQGIIDIFPDSGLTAKETDYINITINAERLVPGWYAEDMIIRSTGGDVTVEMSFEVADNTLSKILDVFRYVKDNHYMYTTNSINDTERMRLLGYRKEGVAFRLFRSDTPGTSCFYHWYNPQKNDHFYASDKQGGGKYLDGYVLEGSIGNIATSRLTNTRELYRWYNPSLGRHFYTTDQNGEGHGSKGYRFETIAGYVR